ncbi:RagB/SusD family nutrient uptake outer membrane protein [Bacteroides sp. 51]|uniref:RagB/SusD family nutrient uptake outer membrane protein n=1 Tax=Bacteroides sp. 51 TaxID=2302938 RepID=UPI0013D682A4|nr:RagB/SusD family nutrient uptake outer membrane protein [Bacteroides sp. 51]NDV82552.1 RagB/SusD family nutrient uptake outer membrane protein [Bacteroides sp. 51]
MKIKNIILVTLMTFGLAGCVDLDYNEVTVRDEEWVYSSPINGIKNMVFDVYAQVFHEFRTGYNGAWMNGAIKASATDEADYALSMSDVHKYYNGGWSPANPFPDTWIVAYRAIAEIHTYLEKIDKVNLDEYIYDSNYHNMLLQFELFPYELRFLRAYFYFELAKSYGDVPLITTTLTNAEANSATRTPVQEIFKFIVDECDAIAEYLPYTYLDEPGAEIGRATRGAVLALKARTLLYAASPLFNKDNNKELWRQAALASKDLIDRASGWGIKLSTYNKLWGHDAFYNPEIIFGFGRGASNDFERANYPVGIENGNSGNCPTQSLVDAYEYADNGETFKERHPGQINVTTEDPYAGLDPRFELTIVKNGDRWPSNSIQQIEIQSYVGGFNGAPKYGATTTGYYLKKYVDGNCVTTYNNPTTRRHTWIVMRLAEVYLNYAEAMYNYYDDADSKGDFDMSANEAINVLRNRPDIMMPEFSGSSNFEERYMRERMVELAFEDHRFWDVRRWQKGSECFSAITSANLQNLNGEVILNRETVIRTWNDKYNLHPIPQSEIKKNDNLTQNPGW